MSLTRNQWVEMWDSTKVIERKLESLRNSVIHQMELRHIAVALTEVGKIKKQIESVIGQME